MHTDASKLDGTTTAKALADWREALAKEIAAVEAANAAPSDPGSSRRNDKATRRVRALARQAWERPVSGPADVLLRAEIAQHCLWGHYANSDGVPRFEAVLGGENAERCLELDPFGERAVAELVKAALWTPQVAADTPAEPDGPPASGAPSQRPDILQFRLGRAIETFGQGLATLHTLVHAHAANAAGEESLDPDLRISLLFCIGQLNEVLEDLEKLVEGIEVRPKAPAGAVAQPTPIAASRSVPHRDWLAQPAADKGDADEAAGATNVIQVPMPEDVPILVDNAKANIDAARVLWTSNDLDDKSPDRRVTEAFWSCIDTAEMHLNRMGELIDAATRRAVEEAAGERP